MKTTPEEKEEGKMEKEKGKKGKGKKSDYENRGGRRRTTKRIRGRRKENNQDIYIPSSSNS